MWAQAHHMVHWEDGGATDERNLVLVCQPHHRAIHEHGFQLRWSRDGERIETVRPDGTVIEIPGSRIGHDRWQSTGVARLTDP
jgi:hypothetical protein